MVMDVVVVYLYVVAERKKFDIQNKWQWISDTLIYTVQLYGSLSIPEDMESERLNRTFPPIALQQQQRLELVNPLDDMHLASERTNEYSDEQRCTTIHDISCLFCVPLPVAYDDLGYRCFTI